MCNFRMKGFIYSSWSCAFRNRLHVLKSQKSQTQLYIDFNILTFNITEMSVIAVNFLSVFDNLFFGFMLIVHNIFFLTVIHYILVYLKITIFSNLEDLGF